eukprot:SAG31_NODE_756_length_12303_cov_8.918142_9_plen_273_part_00
MLGATRADLLSMDFIDWFQVKLTAANRNNAELRRVAVEHCAATLAAYPANEHVLVVVASAAAHQWFFAGMPSWDYFQSQWRNLRQGGSRRTIAAPDLRLYTQPQKSLTRRYQLGNKKLTVWAVPGWSSKNQIPNSGNVQTAMLEYIDVFCNSLSKHGNESEYVSVITNEGSPVALALQDPECQIELGNGFVTLGSVAEALRLLPEFEGRSTRSLTSELGNNVSNLNRMVLDLGCTRFRDMGRRITFQDKLVSCNGYRGMRLKSVGATMVERQ